MRQYFGKYRGKVVSNADPLAQGRLQVSVPSVLGQGRASWAMPCVPYTGAGVGLFAIPPVGANVWVEFEEGRPDLPIWVGGFWGERETPDPAASATVKVFKTDACTIKLDDTKGSGGLTLEVGDPVTSTTARITMGSSGIEISFGNNKIKLSASSVSVNDGALEVT